MRTKWFVVLLAVVLLGVGVAYASIPDGNGVIHGCYKNSTGMLKVIDSASQSCASGETGLNWNQTGPTGASGPTGPTGPAGASATALWAVVNSDGTLMQGSHVVSSTQVGGPGSSLYTVTFDQDVSGCGWSGTVAEGGPTSIIVRPPTTDTVPIQMNNAGRFSIAVFC